MSKAFVATTLTIVAQVIVDTDTGEATLEGPIDTLISAKCLPSGSGSERQAAIGARAAAARLLETTVKKTERFVRQDPEPLFLMPSVKE